MTTAGQKRFDLIKARAVQIWCMETFRGTRQDAWRQASGEYETTPDMFAELIPVATAAPAQSIQADPNQMSLF